MTDAIARVVIDSPLPQLDKLLDYAIPHGMDVRPGIRVRVPLRTGGRLTTGYVVETAESSSFPGTLSDIATVVSPVQVLAPEVWRLARAVADRQAGTAADVLRLAIPKRQVRVEQSWVARTGESGTECPDPDSTSDNRAAQHDTAPDSATDAALHLAVSERSRLDVRCSGVPIRLSSGEWVGSWAHTLAGIAVRVLAGGASTILAVPDYRDLEQLERAFADAGVMDSVVRIDSSQPPAEKYRAFLRTRESMPLILIGNRSVLYAPAPALGAILVWDDGDPLYRELHAPGAHSRDVAMLRQQQQECALVFASHTPSSETHRLVELGYLRTITAGPPDVARRIVGTGAGDERSHDRIPPSAWRRIRASLADGPVLLQVARPGYAPGLACADCGSPARCESCGGPLARDSDASQPQCGWCGALAPDWKCAVCEGHDIRMSSRGTTRTAEELGRAFPGVRIIVSDGDHVRQNVDAHPALVIATRGAEPFADGGYRAVVLLDGARMLQAESLRIAEDTLRWWSNAAALAAPTGEVILVGVGGRIASAFATHAGDQFVATELRERAELHFPPAVRVVTITGELSAVTHALDALPELPSGAVLGPTPFDDGARAIVRFPYAAGPALAAALKAEQITVATQRRSGAHRSAGRHRTTRPTLRVRFDDPEIST